MTTTTASYTRPARPIKLYRFHLSGHSHRAELLLSLLGLPYELIDVDLRAKAHKTETFIKMNCFSQVPVIDDDGVIIADANAILAYLASKYDDGHWLPRDPIGAAAVQRWTLGGQLIGQMVYHHQLLRDGAMPLSVLETKMDRWIARQKRS